mmetsp:Transcript_33394/g.71554  ORF Transcript_33394/g.71554 Transcript_33394/m.71554 type:complete len:1076 (+) Transcript_33394:39-3266(+)
MLTASCCSSRHAAAASRSPRVEGSAVGENDGSRSWSDSIFEELSKLETLCAEEGRQVRQQQQTILRLQQDNARLRDRLLRLAEADPESKCAADDNIFHNRHCHRLLALPSSSSSSDSGIGIGIDKNRWKEEGAPCQATLPSHSKGSAALALALDSRPNNNKNSSSDSNNNNNKGKSVSVSPLLALLPALALDNGAALTSEGILLDESLGGDDEVLQNVHFMEHKKDTFRVAHAPIERPDSETLVDPPSRSPSPSSEDLGTSSLEAARNFFKQHKSSSTLVVEVTASEVNQMRWETLICGLLRPAYQYSIHDVWQQKVSGSGVLRGSTVNLLDKSPTLRRVDGKGRPIVEEVEEADGGSWCSERFVFHPNSWFRMVWVFLSVLLLSHDVVATPLQAAFDIRLAGGHSLILWASVVFWACDFILTFFTAVYVEGYLNYSLRVIALEYIRSWFIFDAVLVFLDWIQFVTWLVDGADLNSETGSVHGLARFFRILRLFRVSRIGKMGVVLGDLLSMSSAGVLLYAGMVKVIVLVLVCIHISACWWYNVGTMDDGWVIREDLQETGSDHSYAIAVNWMLSRFSGTSPALMLSVKEVTTLELLSSIISDMLGLTCCTLLVAQAVNTVHHAMDMHATEVQRTCCRFLRDRRISVGLANKTKGFAAAFARNALRRDHLQAEVDLIKSLPESMQVDLHEEARGVVVCVTDELMASINSVSRAALRELTHLAMIDVFVSNNEVVFYPLSGCNRVLFLDQGSLRYTQHSDDDPGFMGARLSSLLQSHKLVAKGEGISEGVLWTKWHHCGELLSTTSCRTMALQPEQFGQTMRSYSDLFWLAANYSKKFVWLLNDRPETASDLMKVNFRFICPESERTVERSRKEEHHIFLSHYKVEAGTEATLMQEAMINMIEKDPYHPANDFAVPVFLDSENLTDLRMLKSHVKKSHNLVLLLTPKVFTRPWCLVEIVTACANGIKILPVEVQRPGMKFVYPDDEFYLDLWKNLSLGSADVKWLKEMGIDHQQLGAAIRYVFENIAQPFSPHKSASIRQAELWAIMARCSEREGEGGPNNNNNNNTMLEIDAMSG